MEPSRESEPTREIRIEPKTLVLLVGLPGSGKSTFAAEHFSQDAIISTDRIRGEFTNNERNQVVSKQAFGFAERLVKERLARGRVAVVDALNLTEETRERFIQLAVKEGARIQAVVMATSVEESIARDATRARTAGATQIRNRRSQVLIAQRTLETDNRIAWVHSVGPRDKVHLELPAEEMAERKVDAEFRQEAQVAETAIAALESGLVPEQREGEPRRISVEAGTTLFYTRERGDAFLARNFLPHQLVDVERVAARLGAELSEEAVADVASLILRQRASLNLTSVLVLPAGAEYLAAPLKAKLQESAQKQERSFPVTDLFVSPEDQQIATIQIERDAPDDIPLLLVGDVQGCYKSMRELAGRVRRENLEKEEGVAERKIVFVGDMADRGPYDAEAVIYITALVRSGRAILVKGNHDENLLKILKGDPKGGSRETQSTAAELRKRLSEKSIGRIIDMLEKAPVVAQWKNLVVAHASLPRIPRANETLGGNEEFMITHGARSGRFVAGRNEVYKLPETVAHDPGVLVVGGHTHEHEPVVDLATGAAVLDAGVELQGRLWGMYYPEMQLVSAEEPEVLKMHEYLLQRDLPKGKDLLTFIEFARQQSLVETKYGDGEYEGLMIASYSGVTELGNMWEPYPVLRHFRGLIVDREGNIVARPFEKTHKAGDEIPLDRLEVKPKKVFEKANGSLGVVYHWKGKWRVATKFSFENTGYTKPADAMLARMNLSALDPKKTHLFEIILPGDAHIVDYGGEEKLVLLNSIDTETAAMDSWQTVEETARRLGATTAEDMTAHFPDMTVAEIYRFAQEEGNVRNVEGLMALYEDADGRDVLVKVKTREYDDKKFVRDRMDWDKIFDAVDIKTMTLTREAMDRLLSYNIDNTFARAALEVRAQWMRDQYEQTVAEVRRFMLGPTSDAEQLVLQFEAAGMDRKAAVGKALQQSVPNIIRLLESSGLGREKMSTMMGFLRSFLSDSGVPEEALAAHALEQMKKKIESETKKRGQNAFWIIPA